MTNREWLSNLSDTDLALWLCDSLILKNGVLSGVSYVKLSYIQSTVGVEEWLGKKRQENTEDITE